MSTCPKYEPVTVDRGSHVGQGWENWVCNEGFKSWTGVGKLGVKMSTCPKSEPLTMDRGSHLGQGWENWV
jgi:hypothetical protein